MTGKNGNAVAIIGLGCRFPGGGKGLDSFWRTLNLDTDVFVDVVKRRWGEDEVRLADKIYCRAAGLIQKYDAFDAAFFGISAVEAEAMDPQHRLLLETSWHAIEDASIDPHALRGSRTSVIMGATTDDYAQLHSRSGLEVNAYSGLGVAKSMIAGRLAYFYDLKGLTLQIDSSCSSALVATHLAARELRDGSCDLALVGGANIIAAPETTIGFCKMRALSLQGKLRAFDDRADGYVRGEGCAVLVLKRYDDAIRDGNRVRAIIRGSAVNHDGKTNGLTAPNPGAQIAVIRSALANAHCKPDDVQYVETHGTGTPLGDLIEARALGAVYKQRSAPLRIGSAKANVGHLEAAAGAVGLAKVILSFEHGYVPGQVNFQIPNHRIDWAGLRLDISADDWHYCDGTMRAGVSSFGMSGTNVHVILEEPPRRPPTPLAMLSPPITPFIAVSARSPESLESLTTCYAQRLAEARSPEDAMALALASWRRGHHSPYRLTLPLGRAAAQRHRRFTARVPAAERDDLVFVFTGQGTQHSGMAARYFAGSPAFRSSLLASADVFRNETGADLIALLCDPDTDDELSRTEFLQPALVAMNMALADLWQSIGIFPGATVGHSLGEFAAAYVAGSLEAAAAVRLACVRGKAVARLAPPGLMLAALGTAAAIDELRRCLPLGVTLAACNSPQQILLACRPEQEEMLQAIVRERRCRVSRVASNYAFHSTDMQAPAASLLDVFDRVDLRPSTIEWIGTAGLNACDQPSREGGRYLVTQMTEPVGFEAAIAKLLALGFRRFLEIGPDSVLQTAIRTIARDEPIATAGTMRRDRDAWAEFSDNLAAVYEMGVDPDWRSMWSGPVPQVALPAYPFNGRSYWLPTTVATANDESSSPADAELGFHFTLLRQVAAQRWFELKLDGERQPHLLQHRLWDTPIVAAASWMSACLTLGRELLGSDAVTIEQLLLHRPLAILGDRQATLSVRVDRRPDGSLDFAVGDTPDLKSPLCSGSMCAGTAPCPTPPAIDRAGLVAINPDAFYAAFEAQGYHLGPAFRWMGSGHDAADAAYREIQKPDLPADGSAYALFPGMIDSCFHALGGLMRQGFDLGADELAIPFEFRDIRLTGTAGADQALRVAASLRAADGTPLPAMTGRLTLIDGNEVPLLEIGAVSFRRISRAAVARLTDGTIVSLRPISIERLQWRRRPDPAPKQPGELLRLSGRVDFADAERTFQAAFDQGARDIIVRAYDAPDGTVEDWAVRWIGWRDFIELAAAKSAPLRVTILGGATSRWGSLLEGLWLSAAAEKSNLSVRTVEIATSEAGHDLELLAAGELAGTTTGHFRRGKLGWEEQVPSPFEGLASTIDLSGRSALVTGGSGGLGPHFAEWLLSLDAAKVYLVGRSPIEEWPQHQVDPRVDRIRLDILDENCSSAFFAKVAASAAPLGAIVHAAGALADRPLAQLTATDLLTCLAPKVGGAQMLERFWPDGLAFMLAVSSVATLQGSSGQAAYVAANRALEQWARAARASGQPVSTLILGPVDAGMGARLTAAQKRKIREAGAALLPPHMLARGANAAVAAAGEPLVCVAPPATLPGDGRADVTVSRANSAVAIADALRVELDRIMDGSVLLTLDRRLTDFGVDSLLATELSFWTRQHFGVEVTPTTLLELPDLYAAAKLITRLRHEAQTPPSGRQQWLEGTI